MPVPNRINMEKIKKLKARHAVQYAARVGKISRVNDSSCFDCGMQATDYDHHNGYSKENRFDVEPVCRQCHVKREFTRRHGEIGYSGEKYSRRHRRTDNIKITDIEFDEIIVHYHDRKLTQKNIARIYNVTQATISLIITGKRKRLVQS